MLYQIKDKATNQVLHETDSLAKAMKIANRYTLCNIIVLAVSGTTILGKVA